MAISEKKLAYYEYFAEQTCSEECQKIISQLVDEVRKLNAESDLLAKELGNSHCHISTIGPDCPDYYDRNSKNCHKCWREVAERKAVKDD